MDFSLNEQQQMLKKAARDYLAARCDKASLDRIAQTERGYDAGMWKEIAGLGWLGLTIPEDLGGTGGDFLDLAALLEETGRALLPAPLFATTVLGATPIMLAGTKAQQAQFLPRIASGEYIFSMALLEADTVYEPSGIALEAKVTGDGFVLSGEKRFVPFSGAADYLICAARTSPAASATPGISLFIVDARAPGVAHTPLKVMGLERKSEVRFERVAVPRDRLLGDKDNAWPVIQQALDRAAVAKSAEILGGAQHVLDMTIEYAKKRVQFGRPIGSFQAVQHHCANMVMGIELARSITWEAAWRISKGLPAGMEASMAKALAGDAYVRAATLGHQVHGGVGLIRDHPMHLYYREARTASYTYGDGAHHLGRVAEAVAAGAQIW